MCYIWVSYFIMGYFYCKLCSVVESSLATWEVVFDSWAMFYCYRYKQGIEVFTETNTRQIFSRMLVMVNILKSCLPLFLIKLLLVVGMCFLRQSFDWLRCMQRNKAVRNVENQKLSKWNLDITIPCQVLSVRSLRSQFYVTMRKHKDPSTCCPAANHQNHNNLKLQTCEKNQWTFWMVSHGLLLQLLQ